MVWDEEYQNKDVYEWYRKLIQIRKEYPAMTDGKTVDIFTDDAYGVFVITKELDGQKISLLAHAKKGKVGHEMINKLSEFVDM